MKEKISKFYFLKRFSLVQQLMIVLGFTGILLVAVLMPLVDYNLASIIDNQMYETLTLSQSSYIYDSYMPKKQDKPTYHIVYNSTLNAFTSTNIVSEQSVYDLYNHLFGEDLQKLLNNSKQTIKDKGKYSNKTFYFMITQFSDDNYLISIVNSDYSTSLITSLRNQIIYIQYGFFIVFAIIMILWVLTLINPLKTIKNYIDNIKERKKCELYIDRNDEIGFVAKALVDMKENLDIQESNKEENTAKSNDEKEIELAEKEWGEDDSVKFSIEEKKGSKYYVAVKRDATVISWYEVDTETWKISEY